jgi:membrane peptidoglycan carboxypeptidase
VRDFAGAPCQPRCSLADAATGSLNVPYYALTERLRAATVIEAARDAGIDAMWVPDSSTAQRQRLQLRGRPGSAVSPRPFGTDVALGDYPVTVLDQANAMATFAAGGRRMDAHFVRRVSKDAATVIGERSTGGEREFTATAVNDLTWALAQNPSGQLPDRRASATKTGVGLLRTSQVETAHAWIVGYTANLAMAVWIGNEEVEFPLRDAEGGRVTGTGLPAEIYRTFMPAAHEKLGLAVSAFAEPTFAGRADAGDG